MAVKIVNPSVKPKLNKEKEKEDSAKRIQQIMQDQSERNSDRAGWVNPNGAKKDIGQERNQDKAGWVNPNGQKKSTAAPKGQAPISKKDAGAIKYSTMKQSSKERLETAVKQNVPSGTAPKTAPISKKSAPKDVGQSRNQDKAGWVNPNGQKKTTTTKSTVTIEGKKDNGTRVKGSKPKTSTTPTKTKSKTKETLKKAFNAEQVMKERRAKAMANRDKSKNPNNINLRGIVKSKKKGKR